MLNKLEKLIKKMGDGFYKIKIKNGKIETVWVENSISSKELEKMGDK